MRRSTVAGALAVVLALGAVAVAFAGVPGDDDRATVTVVDENGTELATVDAEVADTGLERYRGLSDHESLENGSGMLFVFDEEDERAFVMRDMAFPLDIVFVAANGTITEIHDAPVPPEDSDDRTRYSGQAKWVLEVPRGYADANGICEGDELRIER